MHSKPGGGWLKLGSYGHREHRRSRAQRSRVKAGELEVAACDWQGEGHGLNKQFSLK